jgi:hypothetical protein
MIFRETLILIFRQNLLSLTWMSLRLTLSLREILMRRSGNRAMMKKLES